MKSLPSLSALVLATAVIYSSSAAADQKMPDLSGWHEASQKAAKHMIDKYGPPAEVTETTLMWHKTGPWKHTIISKEAVDHNFPMPHPDVMEQVVDYDVPIDFFDDLAAYDGSVIVERTKGEISARCDKEEANFLALNLANDIVKGKRSWKEARAFYADTMKALMAGGKPEYTQGFVFDVAAKDITNTDEPAKM